MGEDATAVLDGHLLHGLGPVVKGGDDGEDGRACLGCRGHITDVDEVEGRFADAENERTALLERDIGCAFDKAVGEAVADGGERAHGAGQHDHAVRGIAAASDACADVAVFKQVELGVVRDGRGSEFLERFEEATAPAGQAVLFGQDTHRVVGDEEADALDAIVRAKEVEHGGGEDGAAGAGDGEGEVAGALGEWGHASRWDCVCRLWVSSRFARICRSSPYPLLRMTLLEVKLKRRRG